ncbi:uncharacterized protein LOC113352361 [Papaver somniferum]|uniref:uncharacterized protein LOC113352361 n=1 Tax=Papaver somniferum TaxID=3469 RepID=UPI000E6F5071|nr:uncharacterized protein LOC113352361 [Papaver somniferum]
MATPMPTTGKLQSNTREKSIDQELYRCMIGSLLYLTATRPDIAFSVGCCARFQADLKESHRKVVKRIIRYINGTLDYGLSYSMDTKNSLVAYSDADWAGCVEDRKSTYGGCFYSTGQVSTSIWVEIIAKVDRRLLKIKSLTRKIIKLLKDA